MSRLKKDIPRVRNPGAPPEKDPTHFTGYLCDLCNSPSPFTELRQCILCGRWACPSCWKDEYYVCSSCNGMIALHTFRDSVKK